MVAFMPSLLALYLVVCSLCFLHTLEVSAQTGIEGKRGPGGRGGRGGAAAAVAPKVPPKQDEESISDSPHNIQVSSKAQFDEIMKVDNPKDATFVKFYAPWCGHCKSMAADWNKLADHYGGNDLIDIASVDITQNQDIGKALEIKGFPTLKLFSKGDTYEYKGRRTFDSLKSFVDSGYRSQGKVKTASEMNIFDHAMKHYNEFMIRVLKVVQKDFLLPLAMLLVGFILQKIVANYFPKKADPKEVEKMKRMLRKRKELSAQAKRTQEEAKTKSVEKKLVKDERVSDQSQIDDDDDENDDVDH